VTAALWAGDMFIGPLRGNQLFKFALALLTDELVQDHRDLLMCWGCKNARCSRKNSEFSFAAGKTEFILLILNVKM
jgi:hypothetical protein